MLNLSSQSVYYKISADSCIYRGAFDLNFSVLHIQMLCYEVNICPTRLMIHKLYRALKCVSLLDLIPFLGNDDNIYRPVNCGESSFLSLKMVQVNIQ